MLHRPHAATRPPRLLRDPAPHHPTRQLPLRTCSLTTRIAAAYFSWLGEYSAKYGARVLACYLITNHVHIVAVPKTPDAVEKVFRTLRARMVRRNYRWSSAPAHGGLRPDAVLSPDREWLGQLKSVSNWSKWLAKGERARATGYSLTNK